MELNLEYSKRIELILAKQKIRKKKNTLKKKEENTKINDIRKKLISLNSLLSNDITESEQQNKLLLELKNDGITYPINIELSNTNYQKLLSDNNDFYKIKDKLFQEELNDYDSDIQHQKKNIMKQFNEQNMFLIQKVKSKESEIQEIDETIKKKKQTLNIEIKENQINLGNRFSNRNKNISLLDKFHNQIKENRIKTHKTKLNLKNKENELKILLEQHICINNTKLQQLNSYIKNQKIQIKNEKDYNKKKQYFSNIKNKNNDHTHFLEEFKTKKKTLQNEINKLKSLSISDTIIPKANSISKAIIPKANSISKAISPKAISKVKDLKNIKTLQNDISSLLYSLHALKIEKETINNLLNLNKEKYEDKIFTLDFLNENKKEEIKIKIIDNKIKFEAKEKEILQNKDNELHLNKTLIKKYLLDTIIFLYNKKKTSLQILQIKKELENKKNRIKNTEEKINNNTYILDKISTKYEILQFERDEEDNLLSIDELLEIQELKQKILSC